MVEATADTMEADIHTEVDTHTVILIGMMYIQNMLQHSVLQKKNVSSKRKSSMNLVKDTFLLISL